jgi:hypothetical protein
LVTIGKNMGNIGFIGVKLATLFPSGTDIVAVDANFDVVFQLHRVANAKIGIG